MSKSLVRVGTESIAFTIKGKTIRINVPYELYKAEVPNTKDPLGNPLDLWKVYVPMINMEYVNSTEEFVFSDFHECFSEDAVTHFAKNLLEKMKKKKENEPD